jgi:uncharacterized iron-regulated membrane protein
LPNYRILNRKLHRWAALAIALPFLIVICTGILLQLKKQIPWVQPHEQRGSEAAPTLTLDRILEIAQRVPEARVQSWSDIERIDIRPDKGLLKVIPKSRWEIQVDLGSGSVLQVAYRRSDLIETLHDGSFFHANVKLFLFLPVGIAVLGLWSTGIYLFVLPFLARRARRHRIAADASRPLASVAGEQQTP